MSAMIHRHHKHADNENRYNKRDTETTKSKKETKAENSNSQSLSTSSQSTKESTKSSVSQSSSTSTQSTSSSVSQSSSTSTQSTSSSSQTTNGSTKSSISESLSTGTQSTSSNTSQSTKSSGLPKILALPTLSTTMPTLATTTSGALPSISLAVPPGAQAQGKYRANPYIHTPTLPSGLAFIISGSILAAIIFGYLCYNVVTYIIHNKKARDEKEVYYHNFNHSYFDSSSSQTLSSSSMYLPGKYQGTDTSTFVDNSQGRSYRESIMGEKSNRGSMFISPVLELMNSKTDLSLPMYQKPFDSSTLNGSNESSLRMHQKPFDTSTISCSTVSPVFKSVPTTLDPNSTPNPEIGSVVGNDRVDTDSVKTDLMLNQDSSIYKSPKFNIRKSQETDLFDLFDLNSTMPLNKTDKEAKPKRKDSRPPSQYLDDLLNDVNIDYL